jgi:hypothetical protein
MCDNLVLRYQTMLSQDIFDSCKLLKDTETRFHQLFKRQGKPFCYMIMAVCI